MGQSSTVRLSLPASIAVVFIIEWNDPVYQNPIMILFVVVRFLIGLVGSEETGRVTAQVSVRLTVPPMDLFLLIDSPDPPIGLSLILFDFCYAPLKEFRDICQYK